MAQSEQHYTLAQPSFEQPVKLLIVVAPYYKDIADNLLQGATQQITDVGGTFDVAEVPGALEIPTAIGIAERLQKFDGYVALGCVIRGETYHFDLVANESARGIMDLTLIDGIAIGNGIITTENEEQALVRADAAQKDKGGDAARACLAMIALRRRFAAEGPVEV